MLHVIGSDSKRPVEWKQSDPRRISEREDTVSFAAAKRLSRAIGPDDLDRRVRRRLAKPEVAAGIVAADVAVAGVGPATDLAAVLGFQRQLRATGIAPAMLRFDSSHGQPMPA